MATKYQREPGGNWYINYSLNGRQIQRSLKTRDRTMADQKLKEVEHDLAAINLGLERRVRLRPVSEEYYSFRETRSGKDAFS